MVWQCNDVQCLLLENMYPAACCCKVPEQNTIDLEVSEFSLMKDEVDKFAVKRIFQFRELVLHNLSAEEEKTMISYATSMWNQALRHRKAFEDDGSSVLCFYHVIQGEFLKQKLLEKPVITYIRDKYKLHFPGQHEIALLTNDNVKEKAELYLATRHSREDKVFKKNVSHSDGNNREYPPGQIFTHMTRNCAGRTRFETSTHRLDPLLLWHYSSDDHAHDPLQYERKGFARGSKENYKRDYHCLQWKDKREVLMISSPYDSSTEELRRTVKKVQVEKSISTRWEEMKKMLLQDMQQGTNTTLGKRRELYSFKPYSIHPHGPLACARILSNRIGGRVNAVQDNTKSQRKNGNIEAKVIDDIDLMKLLPGFTLFYDASTSSQIEDNSFMALIDSFKRYKFGQLEVVNEDSNHWRNLKMADGQQIESTTIITFRVRAAGNPVSSPVNLFNETTFTHA
ncbi:hypothetical protein J6590_079993 [Homalodisca vitripennis]|nr:hypothetical protein J6590_079993 [Homalodisca vitripennis]